MKIVRKVSLLMALALIVTIGGVYATWSYAGANTTENHQHMSINLATASTTTAEGVILNVSNGMNILIDQGDSSYNAKLVISGNMGFVFKPNSGAPLDVQQNGINMQWALEQTDPGLQYNGANIFTITQTVPVALTSTKITADNYSRFSGVTTDHIGGFYVEVTAEMVDEYLQVSLSLPTHSHYLDFKSALGNSAGKVGVTISEIVTVPAD